MFKTNGEKALAAICLITVLMIAMVFVTGAGQSTTATSSVDAAVVQYFERMPDDSYRISAEELKALLDSKADVFVLDLRSETDYQKDHISGAANIPFADLGKRYKEIPQEKLVVLYCYTGQNGGQAVAAMNLLGYEAKSVSGGWDNGWLVLSGGNTAPASDSSCGS